jgi:DNA-directed RNA polymerase sigma subunit (sigma70/sigma32)
MKSNLDPEWVRSALKRWGEFVSEQERETLVLYYGLKGERRLVHREIGQRFNLSSSRISRIRARGIRRLKGAENLAARIEARKQAGS